jgi:hypothetical protein
MADDIRKITVQVEVEGESSRFLIQWTTGELQIVASPNLPPKILVLINDLWSGHAPTTL